MPLIPIFNLDNCDYGRSSILVQRVNVFGSSLFSGLVNCFILINFYNVRKWNLCHVLLPVLMSSHLNSGRACPGGRPCRSRYPRPSWTRRRRRTSTLPSSAPISSPPAASAGCVGTATPPEASRKRYGTLHCTHTDAFALCLSSSRDCLHTSTASIPCPADSSGWCVGQGR